MLALTLAGLSTDQGNLAVGEGIAVMTMVSDRLLGYAREVLNEWKTQRIEEWKARKALRVEIGKKRKDIDNGIMGLEGLHRSLAWEKEGLKTPETSPGLVKSYTEIYQRLRVAYGIPEILPNISETVDEADPKSWKQAITGKNKAYWLKTAYDEMTSIAQMVVFEILPNMPFSRKALLAKWVFSTKKSRDGKIVKFKTRWVALGDLQKKGVDYRETFAPVANLASLRLMLKKIVPDDLELDQSDVISEFLNGDIDTMVFLRQPKGFTIGIGVCILHKSIYRLCQAARIWYGVVDETLVAIGFKRLFADQAVWVKINSDFQCVIGHVDDLLTGGTRARVDETKAALQKRFKLKDLGPANVFVGLHIVRDMANRTIMLDQIHYAMKILELYGLGDCNAVSVPMQPGTQLLKTNEKLPEHEIKLYQGMVGSLGYIMNCTRPDLAYAVGKVAQFASCPSAQHISAVKHIIRYLKGSLNTIHCI